MADPRGISTAVFEPTPMRDFTKDIALGRQMKAAAQEAENTAYDSYLEQYGVELPKDVPYPYQDAVNTLLDDYRNEASRVYSLRGTPEYAKELSKLKNTQEGIRSAISGVKYKFAYADANQKLLNQFKDNLAPSAYSSVVEDINTTLNPTGSFQRDSEDGTIYWGDKPVGEAFRVTAFEPPVEDIDPFNAMISQEEVDVNNWGQINSDGSITFAPHKAMRFLDTEKRLNSKYYLDLAKQVIGRPNLDNETTISMLQDDNSLVSEVDDIFLKKAESRFKEGRGYKDEGGGDFNFGFGNYAKAKGSYFSDMDGNLEGITFGGYAIPVLRVRGSGDNKTTEVKVSDIIKDANGNYIARGFIEEQGGGRTAYKETLSKELIGQIEADLKIDDFFDWFEAKKALKSGQQSTEQPVKVEETEQTYLFKGEPYTLTELKAQYGDDFNPLDYEGFELKQD